MAYRKLCFLVTREAVLHWWFWLATESLVKIIDESPHSWQKSFFMVSHTLFYISCDIQIVDIYMYIVSFFPRWLFLELLGFISYFGVLLVRGSSYILELTICMITVFSISLFCYVLADMDEPFHGNFRLDISGLSDLLYTIQDCHQQVAEDIANPAIKTPCWKH